MARKRKTAAEAPPPEAVPERATAVAEANPVEAPARDSRFRSWVTDRANGYERLTDEKGRQIVLKFAEQPSEDTRAKLKRLGSVSSRSISANGKSGRDATISRAGSRSSNLKQPSAARHGPGAADIFLHVPSTIRQKPSST